MIRKSMQKLPILDNLIFLQHSIAHKLFPQPFCVYRKHILSARTPSSFSM